MNTALEVKEDGQIWLVLGLASPYESDSRIHQKALASAERLLVSNQLFAYHLIGIHFPELDTIDYTPGIYPIPGLKWEPCAKDVQWEGKWHKAVIISLPESKSESPLIGERSAEEMLEQIVRADKDHFAATTYEEDGAGGSSRYTRNDLVKKAMEEYASQFKAKEDSLPEATSLEYCHKRMAEAYNEIRRLEQENIKLKAFGEWISVNDRLPEGGRPVLCHNGVRMVENSWEEHTDQDAAWFKETFPHWMPLPSPPRKPE